MLVLRVYWRYVIMCNSCVIDKNNVSIHVYMYIVVHRELSLAWGKHWAHRLNVNCFSGGSSHRKRGVQANAQPSPQAHVQWRNDLNATQEKHLRTDVEPSASVVSIAG